MRKNLKIPRIIKIEKISGMKVYCMFNNGESRIIDFKELFNEWKVTKEDAEYPLLNPKEFRKVRLNNYTLSWKNIGTKLQLEDGSEKVFPYEIGPDVLYEKSKPNENNERTMIGFLIRKARKKAGLTQEQLAMRSGTSRFYISRLENNKTDVELSTFRKIVEAGLGKNLRLMIE